MTIRTVRRAPGADGRAETFNARLSDGEGARSVRAAPSGAVQAKIANTAKIAKPTAGQKTAGPRPMRSSWQL